MSLASRADSTKKRTKMCTNLKPNHYQLKTNNKDVASYWYSS